MLADRSGRKLSRRFRASRRPRLGQLGRVGVEAEADLTAALLDERRESIGETSQDFLSRP
jgi:hypothetical protein